MIHGRHVDVDTTKERLVPWVGMVKYWEVYITRTLPLQYGMAGYVTIFKSMPYHFVQKLVGYRIDLVLLTLFSLV